eukprot:366496-Chlamydomonas_euryale.AAC.30
MDRDRDERPRSQQGHTPQLEVEGLSGWALSDSASDDDRSRSRDGRSMRQAADMQTTRSGGLTEGPASRRERDGAALPVIRHGVRDEARGRTGGTRAQSAAAGVRLHEQPSADQPLRRRFDPAVAARHEYLGGAHVDACLDAR